MRIVALLAVASTRVVAAYDTVRASFTDGTTSTERGFVEIGAQRITAQLDAFSVQCGVNASGSPIILTNLTGMSWHIHEKWTHTDAVGRVGPTNCGPAFTGGHYEPTFACGPASQHRKMVKMVNGTINVGACASLPFAPAAACKKEEDKCFERGCVGPSSASLDEGISAYTCSPTSAGYIAQPFQCEVGDMSGKFGGVTMGAAAAVHDDPYMPPVALLDGMSIVFHCPGTGQRAVCGKLVATAKTATTPVVEPFTDPTTTLYAMFHPTVGSRATIGNFELTSTGITADIDLGKLTAESIGTAVAEVCEGSTLQWHIHERWKHSNGRVAALGADACGLAWTSNHYDPLLACSNFSHNSRCKNAQFPISGCIAPSSAIEGGPHGWNTTRPYECNNALFGTQPFACEVGDLSGKYGDFAIDAAGKGSFNKVNPAFLPPLSTLLGKSIVYHCAGQRSFCAALSATPPHDVVQATFQYTPAGAGAKKRAVGFATLDGPEIAMELDFGALSAPEFATFAASCSDGIKYHIHDAWNPAIAAHTSFFDTTGAQCTAAVVGGHYDPGLACGTKSAKIGTDCVATGKATSTCPAFRPAYACSPESYKTDPYGCEMGDLSGKFGNLLLDTATKKSVRNDFDAFYQCSFSPKALFYSLSFYFQDLQLFFDFCE